MNWNLIGHQWAVNLLHKHLADNNLRHAYLITGPDGIGRRLLALRLTQALFCESPPSEGVPCYHCRTCQQIEREEHPDLYTIQVEEGTQVIKIDQIRDLQHALSLSPYEQQFQIGILQEFEKANPSAQNALLKTLEEPPPRVVLILTAESGEQLLETITSRCEGIDLRPVPRKTIQRELQQRRELSTERATSPREDRVMPSACWTTPSCSNSARPGLTNIRNFSPPPSSSALPMPNALKTTPKRSRKSSIPGSRSGATSCSPAPAPPAR